MGQRPVYRYVTDGSTARIRAEHGELPPDSMTDVVVRLAGRLTALRKHGRLAFGTLRDATGEIQLYLDGKGFDGVARGDWVGVRGTVMTTRRGELSVGVDELTPLAAALRPPPKELTDPEERYRHRYLDLALNERAREAVRLRHSALATVRQTLSDQGFIEVETPAGRDAGATGEHLAQLVVGGLERVFDLSRLHDDEDRTVLTAYRAFADQHDMMALVEQLVRAAAPNVAEAGQGTPWPRVRFADLLEATTGARMHPGMPREQARSELERLGVPYRSGWAAGRLMEELYVTRVRRELTGPVFCVDRPREVAPLAREHRDDPDYAEHSELVVAGRVLAEVRSVSTDPEDGSPDPDQRLALEYGLPPTGGLILGIDRLVMALAGAESVREVILFPPSRAVRHRESDERTPAAGAVGSARPEGAGPDTRTPVAGPSDPAPVGASGIGLVRPGTPGVRPGSPESRPGTPESQPGTPEAVRPAARRTSVDEPRWPVRLVAGLTALSGMLELLVPLPSLHRHFLPMADAFDPTWFAVAGQVLSVLVGLGLLLLADQLAKRKRAAWRIAVVLFAAGTVAHAVKGWHHPLPVVTNFAMVTALVLTQDRFRAAPDPPSLLRLARFVPTYLVAVLTVGVGSLWLERHHLSPAFNLPAALDTVLGGLIGLDGDFVYQRHRFEIIFSAALLALGVVGLGVFALLVFRPLRARGPHTDADWRHATRLVHDHGWDTLAYFALREDKSFFFSSDGEAMLAYTYVGGYALVAGDPIGAPDSLSRVLDEFLGMCDERAWNPAFLAIRESDFPAYARRGFRSFYLGDEAIMRCDTFDLSAAPKNVRAAVRRVGRRYRFQVLAEAATPPGLVRELNAISARWRGKAPERGFTMSLSQDILGEGANPEFLLCVALDEDDHPGGLLRLVPAYGSDFGYTLDLMRHDPDAPNGMTEFLIAATARALGERGVVRLSMNFAMWGRLFADDVPFTPAERVARRLVGALNPFFQIRSLRDFNAKFSPEWLPRVLAYRRPTDLPKVGLLYAGAEGFLALPLIGDLLVPKAVPNEAGKPT